MQELTDDKRAVMMKTLMRFPAPGQPAFISAIVYGDFPDLVLALKSEGESEGTMMELKNMEPMKTIRMRQKVCLMARGRSLFGFALSPAVTASISVPE